MPRQVTRPDGKIITVYDREDVGPKRVNKQDVELSDEEKDMVLARWNAFEAERPEREEAAVAEKLIEEEQRKSLRSDAIKRLKQRGVLPQDYEE